MQYVLSGLNADLRWLNEEDHTDTLQRIASLKTEKGPGGVQPCPGRDSPMEAANVLRVSSTRKWNSADLRKMHNELSLSYQQMPDWTAIPFSVLAYLGGVATKPLQTWFEERRERHKLRQALYVEMATLISRCTLTIAELGSDPSVAQHIDIYITPLWPCRCYEHAKTMPIVLNLLPDARGINSLYGGLEAISNAYQRTIATNKPREWFTPVFIQSLRGITYVIENKLDKALLLKVGDDRTATFIRGIQGLEDLRKGFEAIAQSVAPSPAPPQP